MRALSWGPTDGAHERSPGGPEGVDSEQLKKLKREASIRSREDEYERKKRAEEERKRQQLAELKREYEEQEQQRINQQLSAAKRRAKLRMQQKEAAERLEKRREQKIKEKQAAWRRRVDDEIQQVIRAHAQEEERLHEALEEARQRKHALIARTAAAARQARATQEELDMQRDEMQEQRAAMRDVRAGNRVDELKVEAMEELQSFLQQPYPVPLRQVLAGRLKAVPTVTELLAAYKDTREDLKELEDQDIPMRAVLRNQTLFQYVRNIQMKAEADRVRPPEPSAADLGRSRAGAGRRSPGSPPRTGQTRKSQSVSRSGISRRGR